MIASLYKRPTNSALEGSGTQLKVPIEEKVTVNQTVNTGVEKALGKQVQMPLKLLELDPVLNTEGDIVHVLMKVMEGVNVMQIADWEDLGVHH